ncbi:MAG TPA: PilZ domain-containing protein [Bdellovibrionota bacterium]|nr:PilZ domain-containing protein [Bdellovibrionota bacterium]
MRGIFENKTIIIVDADLDLREMLAFEFRARGAITREFSNAQLAIESGISSANGIITEVYTPRGSGIDLLIQTRKISETIPVILTNGFSDISDAEAFRLGASAVFLKPFDLKVLARALGGMLDPQSGRNARRAARYSTDIPTELRLTKTARKVEGRIFNISRTGAFVHLATEVPEQGEIVNFAFRFEKGPTIQIRGKAVVRWTRSDSGQDLPTGCGIEFQDLPETAQAEMARVLEVLNADHDKWVSQFRP